MSKEQNEVLKDQAYLQINENTEQTSKAADYSGFGSGPGPAFTVPNG
jgi:hypothetical protein